jgi:beta-lactamase superfamily II metal-dependent hydrolase
VLHPKPGDKFSRADDGAVVLALEHAGTRVLLVSDLGPAGQKTLLNRHSDLSADILVTGLPTAGEPISDELIEAVQPQAIIVCDADFPAAERASPGLCQRLAWTGVPVLYTRSCGSVEIRITRRGWRLVPMEGRRFIGTGDRAIDKDFKEQTPALLAIEFG